MNTSRIRPTQAEHDAADYERECMRCGNLIPEGKPATLVTDSMSGPDKWQCSSCDELEALRAPVDVEAEVDTLGADIQSLYEDGRGIGWSEAVRVVRPHVERAARLAREAEGLRAINIRLQTEVMRLALGASTLQDGHAAARAEIERLRADLARETARRDEQIAQLEKRLGERETEVTMGRIEATRLTAEIERLKDRPGKVFSEVIMRKDGQRYIGGWYDHSGQEYAHVTEAWLATRLFEQTGYEWTVRISEHGNGHYSAVATSGE